LCLAAALAAAAFIAVPRGYEAGRLLAAQDDPAQLADLALASFDEASARREIEAALAANDPELAQSFVELALERGIPVDPALKARTQDVERESASLGHTLRNFAHGFVTGEPDDMAGIAGTALGDLLVFGDVRDTIREGTRLARGEETSRLVLGLSIGGLAVVLVASLLDLALWVLWAAASLLGFCASLERAVERITLAVIAAGKARRRRREQRAMPARSLPRAALLSQS